MKLYEALSEETIALEVGAREKTEVIAEVAGLLRPGPVVSDFDEFLGAVYAREMESTTGIGQGVAIPHARTDSVTDFVAAMGVCPSGVDFQAIDSKPVKLVVLMGIPTAKVKAYLRMLAHISLLFKQPDTLKRIVKARSPREVLDVLAEHED